jgi:protein-S-isoprenylcysteine O-methyltransferase Ste14
VWPVRGEIEILIEKSSGGRTAATMPIEKLSWGIIITVAMYGVLLFGPAGTLAWWRAWVFLGVVAAGATAGTIYLNRTNPAVLAARFKPPIQKGQPLADRVIVLLLIALFCGEMIFIPLDVFHWQLLPKPGMVASFFGLILFVAGWWIMILALKENPFATLAVTHLEGQQVIDRGVYAVVRHPMYAGAILTVAGMPLWLQSHAAGFLGTVTIGLLGARRITVEEEFLRRELPGYEGYIKRVHYRIVPWVW